MSTVNSNDLVVFQNAYSPYVAVLDSTQALTTASEIIDRIRIQARGSADGLAAAPSDTASILVIDVSTSMREPIGTGPRSVSKLQGAVNGAIKALDAVPEGTPVGVVAFSDMAQVVGPLKPLDAAHKQLLTTSIRGLDVVGGTMMSTGLDLARSMFVKDGREGKSNSVVLLTDGDNNTPDAANLQRVAPACAKVFQAEALGYGLDWKEDALTAIMHQLQSPSVPELVRKPDEVGAFFQRLLGRAAKRGISDLRLRIETRLSAELVQVMQMVPHQEDITARGNRVLVDQADDIWAMEFPFGAYGLDEIRDLLVRWRVKNLPNGQARIIADVSLIYTIGGDTLPATALPLPGQATMAGNVHLRPSQIAALWTNEAARWSQTVSEVDFYTRQTAITEPLREGAAAAGRGDVRKATALLQTAYDAARAANATAQLTQLETLVTPRPDGTVVLRDDIDAGTVKAARLQATTSTMMTTDEA